MSLDKLLGIIDYLGNILGTKPISTNVFIELAISLIIMFSLRVCIILKSAGIKMFHTQKKYKKQKGMILNHVGMEIIIAFLLSFILLLIVQATPQNLIMNMLVAPLLGLIISICIDNWYLIPKESELVYSQITQSEPQRAVNLNEISEVIEIIDQNIIDSDDFRPIVAKSINQIKSVQKEHEIKIDKIDNQCISIMDLLSKLQESEMNDKKISLKKAMYDCLAKGFITPEEREKIKIEYESYINLLNGNSDVQELYENHYCHLEIHEDRRKRNIKVENDRRSEKKLSYGEFDKEST